MAGFRGERPAQLQQAYIDSPEGTDPDGRKFQRMLLGIAAEKLQAGVATREDITAVMARVIQHAERDAQEAMQAMLTEDSPTTDVARQAHFNGRVAAGVLSYINDMIRDGHSAVREINQRDED